MNLIDNKKAHDLGGQGFIEVNTGISTMSNVAQITVPFHNNNLYIVEFNGQPYTPLRQIVQGMGLDWASQFTKIKQKFATCVVEITMQILGDDQSRPHTCIPVRKLAAWLYSVNPNKVKPELRDNVVMYQNECDDVLWDYWTKGQAINQRAAITPEQQALLHEIVARRSNGERKIFAEMWSAKKLIVEQQSAQLSMYGTLLSSASDLWGNFTSIIKNAQGENSATYKAMYLVQQLMAAGQAIIYGNLASAAALAPPPIGLGPVIGEPLSTVVKANGYASAALIMSQTLTGMAHDGIASVPEEGTWLLNKGERVLNPQDNQAFTNFINEGGSRNPTVNVYTLPGQTATATQNDDGSLDIRIQQIAEQTVSNQLANPNSRISKTMQQNYNAQRRR